MLRSAFGQLLSRCAVATTRKLVTQRTLTSQVQSSRTPSIIASIPLLQKTWIQTPKKDPLSRIEIQKIDEIINTWRLPQQLPSSVIVPTVKDFPQINPEVPAIEKQAARMIVIRRRKMKKHKLKKLRKVRKFEYRRMALKRKTHKEKEFQMKLTSLVQEAEKFDAHSYVGNIIRKATEDLDKKGPVVSRRKTRNPMLVDEKGNEIRANESYYARWKID